MKITIMKITNNQTFFGGYIRLFTVSS